MRRTLLALAAILMMTGSVALAEKPGVVDHGLPQFTGERKTIDGELVCMGCSLKQAAGARANCRMFGHSHAVKTTEGKFVILLENKFSKELLAGERFMEKDVSVQGMYFASANVIDVDRFTVDGTTHSWCDGHTKMDDCASK